VAALAVDPTIRRQVLAAARHVLSDDPGAPVDRITRSAGVSRATFYRHFGSRASLLASLEVEPPPDARTRILIAAQDLLLRSSLADLSMDELARAAGVSRGTLYRVFPGKPALLRGLLEAFSPFDAIVQILADRGDQPPSIVLPLLARAIVGVSGSHFGLMRVVFLEVTGGSRAAMSGAGPLFERAIGALMAYLLRQMDAGNLRRMHPLLAIQAVIGPIFFHLMTRPAAEQLVGVPMDAEAAVDELVATALAGLSPTAASQRRRTSRR
jgi:AcrR family transcriptional regulator